MSDALNISYAVPDDAEQIASLYKRVWGGNYRLKEFVEPSEVAKNVLNPKYVWPIAKIDGRVVGSTVGTIEGSQRCELGRTAVDKDYGAQRIASHLCDVMRDGALERGAEVLWGSVRNNQIHKIAHHLGLRVVGYLPGAHAAAEREVILMSQYLSESAKRKRVVPQHADIFGLKSVYGIQKELSLGESRVGKYPLEVIVSEDVQNPALIAGDYHPHERSLRVTSYGSALVIPEYVEVTMFADKNDQILQALEAGFEICAYLPAWVEQGGARFDSVLLAKPLVQPVLKNADFGPIVDGLREGFQFPHSPSIPMRTLRSRDRSPS